MIKNETYFVDIDGTLIKYRKFQHLLSETAKPIKSVVEKVKEEYEKGSHIIITSARPEIFRDFTKKELKDIGVEYHQLILGIGRGARVIINDKDPDFPKDKRAIGINLVRDKGIQK
jgi:hypothetical protein